MHEPRLKHTPRVAAEISRPAEVRAFITIRILGAEQTEQACDGVVHAIHTPQGSAFKNSDQLELLKLGADTNPLKSHAQCLDWCRLGRREYP